MEILLYYYLFPEERSEEHSPESLKWRYKLLFDSQELKDMRTSFHLRNIQQHVLIPLGPACNFGNNENNNDYSHL